MASLVKIPNQRTKTLPPLGFGGAAIGNLYRAVSDLEARETIDAAWASGVRYFDTAPHYGFGLSETRLGSALAQLDPEGDAVVSTKVGRLLAPIEAQSASSRRHGFVDANAFEPVFDYSRDGVMRSFEASLQRLGRDRIDILFAHDLGEVTHGAAHPERWREFMSGGYPAMLALRDSGAVGAIGIGANEWQVCEQGLNEGDFDVFLLAGRYTLLEQTAIDSFLPACAERGVHVVVGGPFNSGVLAGSNAGGPYDYGPAPDWVVARVEALRSVSADWAVDLPAAALQFPLAHPQVASVIPGVASPEQARVAADHMAASIPAGFWADLKSRGLIAAAAPLPSPAVSPVILLHPDDDVLVCRAPLSAGAAIEIDGTTVNAAGAVEVGHKVARHALAVGDRVRKYGAPIGSMTAAAGPGEHVHLHNMKSDYIPSHTRDAASEARA